MAKKSTRKSAGAAKAAGARKRGGGRKGAKKKAASNLDRFRAADAIDPDSANNLDPTGLARVASLTKLEVTKMISAHAKLSPTKGFEPDPDGSIF